MCIETAIYTQKTEQRKELGIWGLRYVEAYCVPFSIMRK